MPRIKSSVFGKIVANCKLKLLTNSCANDIIITQKGGATNVSKIGEINPKHFENIFLILTNDVIITEKQIEHIKKRHSGDYEMYSTYIPEILKEPDYIIEANKPNSVVLLKSFSENDKYFQLILRLKTATEPKNYQNSVISFWKIGENDLKRLIKNKKVLYKAE